MRCDNCGWDKPDNSTYIHIVLHRTGEAPAKLQRVHAGELTIFPEAPGRTHAPDSLLFPLLQLLDKRAHVLWQRRLEGMELAVRVLEMQQMGVECEA